MNKMLRATEVAHVLSSTFLHEGQKVIDATCGNGNDTLFLAERVGATGKVYAFDVQEQALAETRKLLSERQQLDRVELIRDSHENFARYVDSAVDAIIYNLGYLPGGQKEITTNTASTLYSLQEGMKILADGGFISIVAYPGHPQGEQEANEIEKLLRGLPAPPWYVLTYKRLNSLKPSPYLIFIKKQD